MYRESIYIVCVKADDTHDIDRGYQKIPIRIIPLLLGPYWPCLPATHTRHTVRWGANPIPQFPSGPSAFVWPVAS